MKPSKLFLALLTFPLLRLSPAQVASGQTLTVVLANDPTLQSPFSLTTDGTNLFASGARPDGTQGIFKVPANGGAAVQIYQALNPHEVAFLGGDIFWIDPNSGPVTDTQILRAPADGSGPVTAIYTGSLVGQPIVDGHGLVTDGLFLYAADEVQGTVFVLDTGGGNLTEIGGPRYGGFFDTEHENSLAYASGQIFIGDSGKPDSGIPPAVLSLPATGSNFTSLAVGPPLVQPDGICVYGETLFISDPGADNTIWQIPMLGGAPTPLISGAPFQRIKGLAVLSGNLYIADPGAGAIYRLSLNNLPDLQILNLIATNNRAPEGSKVTITATVGNTGNADAAASATAFMDGDSLLGLVATPAIPAGASTKVSLNWFTARENGEHMISATANAGHVITESEYDNNTADITVNLLGNQTR